MEGYTKDAGHGKRLQQRPAEAKHRTAIASAQIEVDQREPEVPTAPDSGEVVDHGRSRPAAMHRSHGMASLQSSVSASFYRLPAYPCLRRTVTQTRPPA